MKARAGALAAPLHDAQPSGLWIRCFEGGFFANLLAGRRGRGTNSPPQFGQRPESRSSTQRTQNVHSKEQILASLESGGRSMLQHSQFGRSLSTLPAVYWKLSWQRRSCADSRLLTWTKQERLRSVRSSHRAWPQVQSSGNSQGLGTQTRSVDSEGPVVET